MDEVLSIDGDNGFGLLSRGAGPRSGADVVVLLNAGVVHRIGPFRMHVQLARALSAAGIDVFRFDLPRVGDGVAEGAASVKAVISAVFDTLTRETGARHFTLGGICSAADMAWRIAQDDARIRGLWLFDGFAHRGRWFRVGRARRALARPLPQWPMLAWKLATRVHTPSTVLDVQEIRDWSEVAQFRMQCAALLARDVRILAMYTGGVGKYLLHPRQLDDTFGAARQHAGLDVEFWPELDHTLLSPVDRNLVIDKVVHWCTTTRAERAAA